MRRRKRGDEVFLPLLEMMDAPRQGWLMPGCYVESKGSIVG